MLTTRESAKENMPELTVPSERQPTVKTPAIETPAATTQYKARMKHFEAATSPDGYSMVVLEKEGITEDVKQDPFWQGKISTRSGVLGQGTRWFKKAERAAAWRQQTSLPDRRYTGGYPAFEQDSVKNYYNAKPLVRSAELKKRGPYQQFINGISYIPKALIVREQPAVKLFTMSGDDPRQPSMEDLENDRKDPWYNTVANNLSDTRSYPRRMQIGNDILQTRGAVDKLNRLRHIKVAAPYGEGIKMSWDPSFDDMQSPKQQMTANLAEHRKKVMDQGIAPHHAAMSAGMGTNPSIH